MPTADDPGTLPDGVTIRPPRLADAQLIYEFVAAYNTAVVGRPDCSLDTITEDLDNPFFTPQTDGWLAFDSAGRLVGSARSRARAGVTSDLGPAVVDVTVQSTDGPAAWLLERALQRAREHGADRRRAEVKAVVGVHREDEALRDLLAAHGFRRGTSFHRLRIDHAGAVARPEPPTGTTIHRGAFDEATRRAVHGVFAAAFAAQDGAAPSPFDEWVDSHDKRRSFDWSQVTLVDLDGGPVAASDCNDAFVETDDCGYLGRLGVVEEARGRGLATFLLRDTFATDAAAGRAGTILHVDTSNPTPALRLYESVGMRTVQVLDVWELILPTDGSAPPAPA